MYRDLIFDLYGTLVDIRTVEDLAAWKKVSLFYGWQGAACSAAQLRAAYRRELEKRRKGPYCEVRTELIFAGLFRQLGVKKNALALGNEAARIFRIASTRYLRLYPGVLEALARFRAMGCRVWLLSNAQQVFTLPELRLLGLEDAFDGVYLSSQYGCCKPAEGFFRALTDNEGLDPKACLMVGNDLIADIQGAKAMGMATLYLRTAQTPQDQPPAKAELCPPAPGSLWEFEGADWNVLAPLVEQVIL